MKMNIRSLEFKNNELFLIDQRVLPQQYKKFICKNFKDVEFAIADMVVRGAPVIGVTAAYGIVLAAIEFIDLPKIDFFREMHLACDLINMSRPTAVNLMWAVTRMKKLLIKGKSQKEIINDLKEEADKIAEEDIITNKKMVIHSYLKRLRSLLTVIPALWQQWNTAQHWELFALLLHPVKKYLSMLMKPAPVYRAADLQPGNWLRKVFPLN